MRRSRRRRREHEHRRRPVVPGHPLQPPQQQRHVRAEHPAVPVTLVDDHVRQLPEQPRPPGVRSEDPPVQHVRVREDPPGVCADPVPLRHRRVPVVRRRPHAVDLQLRHGPQLVRPQRLRRRQVQRARLLVRQQVGQHGQLVGQRLPRRRTGGDDDVAALVRERCRLDLMCPRLVHAGLAQRGDHIRVGPRRPLDATGSPGRSCSATCVTGSADSGMPALTRRSSRRARSISATPSRIAHVYDSPAKSRNDHEQ